MSQLKYLKHFSMTKWFIFSSLMLACTHEDPVVRQLTDTSSNSYYICLSGSYNNDTYEIVVPNQILFYKIKSSDDKYNLDKHIEVFTPILKGKDVLDMSEFLYQELKPYFLPVDWKSVDLDIAKYFQDGVQQNKIDNQLVVITA